MGKIWQTKQIGVCKSIVTLNVRNGKRQNLRRNIKIPRGLVIFNFRFSNDQNVFNFIIGGTTGNVHDHPKSLFLTLDPPNYSKLLA